MSQSSMSPRERSNEPTPLNRAPAAPARPTEPAPAAPASPSAPQREEALAAPAPRNRSGLSRFVLLVVVPAAAVVLGTMWWLSSGRYVSTDNAYVGADKSLITPQVTGPIVAVHVREGERVEAGAPLFDIDPAPYQTALTLAQGRLAAAKVEFANLQASYATNENQIAMGQKAVDLRQNDYNRKLDLVNSHSGTRADLDTSQAALVQAQQILEFVRSQQESTKIKLGGGPAASIDAFPDYIRPRRGSTTPNGTWPALTLSRRFPAWRRRSTRSSSAGSRPRASRCSPSSRTAVCGSTPIRRSRTSLMFTPANRRA